MSDDILRDGIEKQKETIRVLRKAFLEQVKTIERKQDMIADLQQQNKELREAIDALLQPAPSELLSKNLTHPSRMKHSGQ